MIETLEWLSKRLNEAPPSLSERITAAVSSTPCDPNHDRSEHLRQAAESLLSVVKAQGDNGDPLDLLAADAIVTFACESMSEIDPRGLKDFY